MEHRTSGNLDDSGETPIDDSTWSSISIQSQSLDQFKWDVLCDETWADKINNAYTCHRITRRAEALGGHLYAVATHITPTTGESGPTVSESLIFVPDLDVA